MRDDEPNARVSAGYPREDQAQGGNGVLERRPDQPGQVIAGQQRVALVADWMQEYAGSAPIEFLEHRLEHRVIELPVANAAPDGDAHNPVAVSGAIDFGQRLVNVRKW